ncbi:hypothetical protein FCL40_05470 [Ferrimonas sediminicola]|uniref:Uncharacterized protein n=1 Tax=Ferrimonas sediminicola TaxID=2569538 RepID=A0A4U1BKI8_9GAMM|nr:hypothetical protein [Ferrimonas sediminicola]TKB50600.1 hypothetical protein FCL40_05470 [Ferrimonas sediminicola]
MRGWLAALVLVPLLVQANELEECALASVSSDYGEFTLSLRAGEPEILHLGGGHRLALLADPVGRSGLVMISTEARSGHSRLSTNVMVGPGKPASLQVADLSVELRVVPL